MNDRLKKPRGAVVGLLVAVGAAVPATADCTPDWLPGGGLPGISGQVHAQVMWDPDGPGVQPERLVVGGRFSVAGDSLAVNVAMWDGSSWQPMGDGFGGVLSSVNEPEVNALVVTPSGELIAGGRFLKSGTTDLGHLARWDGSSWQPLSVNGGVADIGGTSNEVNALLIMPNGDLAVGGNFVNPFGLTTRHVVIWDGAAWEALPGLEGAFANALAIWSGQLVAAGLFNGPGPESTRANNIARWDGATWQPLGTTGERGMNTIVDALVTLPNGDLVAGGEFVTAGSASVSGLAQWNGTDWSDVGNGGVSDAFGTVVRALAVDSNGDLIVGGRFIMAGGAFGFNGLAKWDGSDWTSLWSSETEFRSTVHSVLTGSGGSIIAGGGFNLASGLPANNVARFDGSTWHAYGNGGTNGAIAAFAETASGQLVVGGEFKLIDGVAANHVAIENGGSWAPLGSGVYATNDYVVFNLPYPTVDALAVLTNGNIVAGGHGFSTSLGGAVVTIAQWDGSDWTAYSPALTTAPFSLPLGSVLDVVQMPNGNIVAAGMFLIDGDPFFQPHFLVEWDGTGWSDLGGVGTDGPVFDLLLVGDDLYIGGEFFSAGGVVGTTGIARWDGTDFYSLNMGLVGGVRSMIMRGSDLIVAGFFGSVSNNAEGDTPADNIARWNGSTWSALSDGGLNFQVETLAVLPSNDLIAGGMFTDTTAGTTPPASRIARWDGAAWHPMGLGIDPDNLHFDEYSVVRALHVDDDGTLLVGGRFGTAGGQVSAHLARWGCGINACPADFNGVNGVTVQDIFDFLTAWLAGNASADFNNVNGVTVQDIFDFLTAWLAGC